MTYIRINSREVMGLTEGERRSLHRSWLGRKPTWEDVKKILDGKVIGPVIHHTDHRSRCDGCQTSVYAWADEVAGDTITGRRFCATCAYHRRGVKWDR